MENYQITRDQIRKLTDPQVKEWFPEAFEVKLEIGKWYKNPKKGEALFFVTKINKDEGTYFAYGFDFRGVWSDDSEFGSLVFFPEATEEEVFEALKNEAIKRGFNKIGVHFKGVNGHDLISDIDIDFWNKNCYSSNENKFNISVCESGGVIYRQGKWATIIETITKKEAEKLLNKKIID